jgi:hypothetical protein
MPAPTTRVFFYGSFINLDVLAQGGFKPQHVETAKLCGFDLHFQPLANLVRSDQRCVYGILCAATHDELAGLYGQAWVETYLPEAVLVEMKDGRLAPALCYLAPPLPAAAPKGDYLDRIIGAARQHGFPQWYVQRLESYRPK